MLISFIFEVCRGLYIDTRAQKSVSVTDKGACVQGSANLVEKGQENVVVVAVDEWAGGHRINQPRGRGGGGEKQK